MSSAPSETSSDGSTWMFSSFQQTTTECLQTAVESRQQQILETTPVTEQFTEQRSPPAAASVHGSGLTRRLKVLGDPVRVKIKMSNYG